MILEYDSDYPTCAVTYVTLRLYHPTLNPDAVTHLLRLRPTRAWATGESRVGQTNRRIGGWLLSSEEAVSSRDVTRHIDWLVEQLHGREDVLRHLQDEGYRMDVFCYWLSAFGHGGPTVSVANMAALANLGLELAFDIYLLDDEGPS